ncbi:hypothetical protein KCP71_23450 [Salmonella enterica subsp. enterica]|nr:hypothetical protein KCP71_23450 [Salmonella enterica subsp. enterica]
MPLRVHCRQPDVSPNQYRPVKLPLPAEISLPVMSCIDIYFLSAPGLSTQKREVVVVIKLSDATGVSSLKRNFYLFAFHFVQLSIKAGFNGCHLAFQARSNL